MCLILKLPLLAKTETGLFPFYRFKYLFSDHSGYRQMPLHKNRTILNLNRGTVPWSNQRRICLIKDLRSSH